MSDKTIWCETCGHKAIVEWEDPLWNLTETCSKCAIIKTLNPEVYDWVLNVIKQQTLSEDKIQKMIDYSLRPPNAYY